MAHYWDLVLSEPSLLAYWRGGDAPGSAVMADSSAGGHALAASALTFGAAGLLSGASASAALYNGTSSTATLPSTDALSWERTQPFSIEALIQPNVVRASGEFAIYSTMLTAAPFSGVQFGLDYGDNGNQLTLELLLINTWSSNVLRVFGSTDLLNGTTYHVAVTYDGSSSAAGVALYVNGARESSVVRFDTLAASILCSAAHAVGSRAAAIQFYAGTMQEVALYSSVLPPPLIEQHATVALRGTALDNPPADLPPPVRLLLDADFDSDVDDADQWVLAHALADRGECVLIGHVCDSSTPSAPACVSAFNRWAGRPALPVGAYRGSDLVNSATYTEPVRDRFGVPGEDWARYPDEVSTYRRLLVAQPDGSVVLCLCGYGSAFANLLASGPDGASAESGQSLVARKVRRVVVAAGFFPSTTALGQSPEWNLAHGTAYWSSALAQCPTDVVWVGIEMGNTVFAGPPANADPASSPLRYAHTLWAGGRDTREAWGPLAVLYAVRGTASGLHFGGIRGTTTLDPATGANSWSQTPNSQHHYLVKAIPDAALAATLNALLAQGPRAQWPSQGAPGLRAPRVQQNAPRSPAFGRTAEPRDAS